MPQRTLDPRGRSPLEEGLSLLPYARVNMRLHRRRLAWGALATAGVTGALWLLARRRPTPGP